MDSDLTRSPDDRKTDWLWDCIEKDVIEKMLCSFSKSTGLKAILVDDSGETIVSTDHEIKDCRFCQMIRSDEQGARKCKRSYARACKDAATYGEPYIFRCHAGLIMWAAPIVLEDHIGAIICGQVLMWEPEDYFLDEIEEMVKDLDVNLNEVKWSAAQLPIMPSDQVQAAADLLFIVANQIMQSGATVLKQRREIAAQQARLAEEIHARKQAEIEIHTLESRTFAMYSLDKEYELQTKVKNGDKEAAHQLLEEILAEILEKYSAKLDTVQAHLIELVVVISRACAAGGAMSKELLQLNSHCYKEILSMTNVEELCLWAREMLDTYLAYVIESNGTRNLQAVQKAADYIKRNYNKKLTIDEIAQAVYLSPCYLSRIFKHTLGCTLMEYKNRVRIEKAKKMLKNPKYTIMQVAEKSGFDDPAYFTRVFKRVEGITPSRFKQNAL